MYLPVERWNELFDLTLQSVGDRFGQFDQLINVARYGHFTEPDLPWESLSFDGCKHRSESAAPFAGRNVQRS
jgi:hypothetical protein